MMLTRQLEPELMDTDEQAKAYAYADFDEPHNLFVDIFQKKFASCIHPDDIILELGCGTGDIVRRMAQRFPHCFIHGVDGSAAMLHYAHHFLNQPEYKNLKKRITYHQGLLSQANLSEDYYDGIISNSLLHHLHNPSVMWQSVKEMAKRNAYVFIMDLKRPKTSQRAKRFMEKYTANEPKILQKDFYHSLLAAFTVDEVQQQLTDHRLAYLTVEDVSPIHMSISGCLS